MRFLFEGMTEMIHADLGPELEAIVLNLIESGKYSSRTQVLRESEELKGWREAKLRALDDELARRLASPRDQYIPFEDARKTILAGLDPEGDFKA
ncbi:type II toxin-antitoxin system ParD family antitoxin [Mitsuaria sp. 7]|uniref:type II toxin-antitoxin system ParD family antitoxin n=1 Tax=Mitsuaria sp. 7 TaxID=1658665 RepID=UPI0012F9AD40|nr:type II toxin-antitoxin system ParD family antitoxin [Mitsuaria sp. 7]